MPEQLQEAAVERGLHGLPRVGSIRRSYVCRGALCPETYFGLPGDQGASAHALAEFANVDTAGDARIPQARGTYRELASTLRARADSIPYYTVWSSLKIVPTFSEIDKASANLIGLSNIIGLQPE